MTPEELAVVIRKAKEIMKLAMEGNMELLEKYYRELPSDGIHLNNILHRNYRRCSTLRRAMFYEMTLDGYSALEIAKAAQISRSSAHYSIKRMKDVLANPSLDSEDYHTYMIYHEAMERRRKEDGTF